MAINFPSNPSNGDTHAGFTYNSSVGAWESTASTPVTQATLDGYLQVANVSSTTTVYTALSDLPMSGNDTGAQAYVSGTNRLYLWNGTGWYNIALINTNPTISGASASYNLNTDGSNTVVTLVASDPEGLPISFTASHTGLGVGANAIATVTQSNNIFTFTPTTNTALAGTFTTTFTASDGVNIAGANSSFTLAFTVNNSNYTTALITSVGTNNQVNNDFVDSSTNSHTITAAGNVTQNTFSPYRHGGYSTYFDGSGDYLSVPSQALGSGDYCYEFWVNHAASGTKVVVDWSNSPQIYTIGTTLYLYVNSANRISTTVEANQWTHIAIVRASGVTTLYNNGVAESTTYTDSNNYTNSTMTIGGRASSAANTLDGYVVDVRVVIGTAVYTSNFTPPTERLTAITNTSLLTCHLPYFADGSTNGHTITVNGNTKTEPFAPYDYGTYSAADNGGSMYFDGTGDYLSIGTSSTNETLSGDFCIEAWIYPTGTNDGTIIGNYLSSPNRGWSFRSFTSNNLYLYFQIDGGSQIVYQTPTNSVNPNDWNHVVWCRSGTDTSVFINGSRSDNRTLSGTSTGAGGVAISALSQGFTSYNFTGYISDTRVVNGSSVYDPSQTTLTVPTAPLTAITNTSLLVQGTNAGIIDKSQSVKNITLNGDVKSSTTQTKYLSSSMYFDGTDDYIDAGNIQFGANDFTIEGWFNFGSTSDQCLIGRFHNYSSNQCWELIYESSSLRFQTNTGSFNNGSVSWVPDTNIWYHIAAVRSGSNKYLFVNGELQSGYPINIGTGALQGESTGTVKIGTRHNLSKDFNGYISDLRITKGLARYTSSFTPPTAALQG